MRALPFAGVGFCTALLVVVAGGCSSGFRNCRAYVDMADRELTSGSTTQMVQGLVMYPLSPIACGFALLVSPFTELTGGDRKQAAARDKPPIIVREVEAAPAAEPAPDSLEVEAISPESSGQLEKVE